MAGHTSVANLWLTDKGKCVIPGAIVGIAFVSATAGSNSKISCDFALGRDAVRIRSLTFINGGGTTQFILPVNLTAGKWSVPTPISEDLEKKGWTLDIANMKVIRMGVVTYVGRESREDEVKESLFNPEQCHHLPRIKVCLGA